MRKRLLFVVNTVNFFISHRLPLAIQAQAMGFQVHVATGSLEDSKLLSDHGFIQHKIPLSRSGKNILSETHSLFKLFQLMRRLRPDLVHLVTIKPVLYGGIAARLARVNAVVAAISGLGTVFIDNGSSSGTLRWLVKRLYKFALGHKNTRVIFQNLDDQRVLIAATNIAEENTVLIRGSGVDLNDYQVVPEPEGVPVVTFAARLIRDKGVVEFVEAAKILHQRNIKVRFLIAGTPDPGNPSTVTETELSQWRRQGEVELLGHHSDISGLFEQSHIVCLPSYYGEGLPKVLIEAAASARAVVTTDHPGCRDAIEAQQTGLLVPVRDAKALADAIEYLLHNETIRRQMGLAGRQLAERLFSIETVVAEHMNIYTTLTEQQVL